MFAQVGADGKVELKADKTSCRMLQMRVDDLFKAPDLEEADIVICETAFPDSGYKKLCSLLDGLKSGHHCGRFFSREDFVVVVQAVAC